MENAAKALLISAGILLALMTLSLIVYVSTATTRLVDAQEKKKAEEELTAFNKEYEAYNKTRMYGTEIITVVNKAIEYNIDAKEKIEITLITTNDYDTIEETVTTDSRGKTTHTKTRIVDGLSLKANTSHNATSLKAFFSQPVEDSLGNEISSHRILNIYCALTTFKRSIFECVPDSDPAGPGVTYNENGRIVHMTFREVANFSDY